jgi:group I intron endonuclease
MDGFVYRWTNKINGRWYLGSHGGSLGDGYIGSGKVFRLALQKYGLTNFNREILYQGEDFYQQETALLQELDAESDPLSYNRKNQALGGNGAGRAVTETTRIKIRDARLTKKAEQGWLNSPEAREKMSVAHRGKTPTEVTRIKKSVTAKLKGINPPAGSHLGHLHSEEAKALISEKTKQGMAKMDKQIIYHSTRHAQHCRWHVNRNIKSTTCSFCLEV